MATFNEPQELFPLAVSPPGSVQINGRCQLQTFSGYCVVTVSGIIFAQYAAGDLMSEAHAMVSLAGQGHAAQNDVSRAFNRSTRTMRRYQTRFAASGLPALARTVGYPKGRPRLSQSRDITVTRLKAAGQSNGDIGRRFGVTEKAIRKQLKRLGWLEPSPVQPLLLSIDGSDPNLSASDAGTLSAPIPPAPPASDPNLSAFIAQASRYHDPQDRAIDRLLARAGLLQDAAPVFSTTAGVPHAGVLLAIPALLKTGVFDCARAAYGDIGPAFYGLRTTILTMLLMALLRIKHPEALKEHAPARSPACATSSANAA